MNPRLEFVEHHARRQQVDCHQVARSALARPHTMTCMEADDVLEALEEALADVPADGRAAVIAAAVGLAFGQIQQWPGDVDQEGALVAVLAAACDQVADGPQSYAEARTDRDWMVEFLERAKGALA
jgi:hypothetical protein